MAKYDQGGGCACGLHAECECLSQTQADGSKTHEDEIFVFGSNLGGYHGAGAAEAAARHYGAKYKTGRGMSGQSYAIPTKDEKIRTLPLDIIKAYVDEFLRYANTHDDKFFVTAIGCGLAGYKVEDIAPMFAKTPTNVRLNSQFESFLSEKRKAYQELKEIFDGK